MIQDTLYHLFAGKSFEFYSAYDLEDSVRQLKIHSKRHKQKPLSWMQTYQLLFIEVDEGDKNSAHFRGDKEVIKNLFIVFSGIIRRESKATIVQGHVRPAILSLLLPIVFLIVWCALFTNPSYGVISSGLIFLGFSATIAIYTSIIQSQNKMIHILTKILHDSEKTNT